MPSVPNVKVYVIRGCPYCVRAKSLLSKAGIPYEEVDISETPEVRDVLARETGERTVPQVFVDGKYIGQDDELHDLIESGRLKVPGPGTPRAAGGRGGRR